MMQIDESERNQQGKWILRVSRSTKRSDSETLFREIDGKIKLRE